jgi:uncharacterized surface protein with fasciclin (FAS1) repeats
MRFFNKNTFFALLVLTCIHGSLSVYQTKYERRDDSRIEIAIFANDSINNFTPSTNANRHEQTQRLVVELAEESISLKKEYRSSMKNVYTNGNDSQNTETLRSKGSKKGKGSTMGKGMGMGKGGTKNTLPRICISNDRGEKGNSGKGNSSSKSKRKRGGKGMNNNFRQTERLLIQPKGTKQNTHTTSGKGKKSGKGKLNDNSCSEFVVDSHVGLQRVQGRDNNVLNVAQEIPEVSVFVSLVYRYNINDILQCNGPFTGLFPTNDAFRLLDPIIFADLLLPTHTEYARQFILNHFFLGIRKERDFKEGSLLSLSNIDVSVNLTPLRFDDNAIAVQTDILGYNGVLHLIDKVLHFNGTTISFHLHVIQ